MGLVSCSVPTGHPRPGLKLLLDHSATVGAQLLCVADGQHVIDEDVKVDALPCRPQSQPLDECLRQSEEETWRFEVPEREPRCPQEAPVARMPHHQPLPAPLRDRHMPEPVSDVILGEVRASLHDGCHTVGRLKGAVGTTRFVPTE